MAGHDSCEKSGSYFSPENGGVTSQKHLGLILI